MHEGDLGETMYFIVSGQVELRGHGGGAVVLTQGDSFGEIALREQCPRTATVRAMNRCQLLILDAHDFHKFAAAYPNLMDDLHATARARLAGQEPGSFSR